MIQKSSCLISPTRRLFFGFIATGALLVSVPLALISGSANQDDGAKENTRRLLQEISIGQNKKRLERERFISRIEDEILTKMRGMIDANPYLDCEQRGFLKAIFSNSDFDKSKIWDMASEENDLLEINDDGKNKLLQNFEKKFLSFAEEVSRLINKHGLPKIEMSAVLKDPSGLFFFFHSYQAYLCYDFAVSELKYNDARLRELESIVKDPALNAQQKSTIIEAIVLRDMNAKQRIESYDPGHNLWAKPELFGY